MEYLLQSLLITTLLSAYIFVSSSIIDICTIGRVAFQSRCKKISLVVSVKLVYFSAQKVFFVVHKKFSYCQWQICTLKFETVKRSQIGKFNFIESSLSTNPGTTSSKEKGLWWHLNLAFPLPPILARPTTHEQPWRLLESHTQK